MARPRTLSKKEFGRGRRRVRPIDQGDVEALAVGELDRLTPRGGTNMKAKKRKARPFHQRGCPCPRCGAATRCVYARPTPAGMFRLRACPHGHRFHTYEAPAEAVFGVAKYASVIRSEKLFANVATGTAPRGAAGILHAAAATAAIDEVPR
jgi:hypothetical protein